jgi:hypothetical protein
VLLPQDPLSCDGTRAYDSGVCIPCKECMDMHALVGIPCTGTSTYDSQSCQKCTATCPVGMAIREDVARCNGKHWASESSPSDRPFDPITECLSCGGCPGWVLVCLCFFACIFVLTNTRIHTHTHTYTHRYYQVRVSGCTGTRRRDDPVCENCARCPVGEYVAGSCTPNSVNMSSTCKACPQCSVGTYLAR